jgi:hypothetical protein
LKPKPPAKSKQKKKKDLRPAWWHALSDKFDLPGRLAERLEGRWQRWWAPVVLLTFPILLLLLALLINALR